MKKTLLLIYFFSIQSCVFAFGDDFWIKYGISPYYTAYNLDKTGLQTDFQRLTAHPEISFKDVNGFSFAHIHFDMGIKHFFVGFAYSLSLGNDMQKSYYESVSSGKYAVDDNVELKISRSMWEARLGVGHFGSDDRNDDIFWAFGPYLFLGKADFTMELNNFTDRDLTYKNITIANGALFNNFETKRFFWGLGINSFVTIGDGPTSIGVGVEVRYSKLTGGVWNLNNRPTDLANSGLNMFSLILIPMIKHNP